MKMDLMSFLVGSLIVMIAFALGAAVVMLMRHLDHHSEMDKQREKDTVVIRQAQSAPKHSELTPPTYPQDLPRRARSASVPVQSVSQAQRVTQPAPTPQTQDTVPVVPISTVPTANGNPVSIPVDAIFDERSASNQQRGGE